MYSHEIYTPKYSLDKPSVSELYLKKLQERNIFSGNFFDRFNNTGGGAPLRNKDGSLKTSFKPLMQNNIDENIYQKFDDNPYHFKLESKYIENYNNNYFDNNNDNNKFDNDNYYNNRNKNYQNIQNQNYDNLRYNNNVNQRNILNSIYFKNSDINYLRQFLPNDNSIYDENYVNAHSRIMKERFNEELYEKKKNEEKEFLKIKEMERQKDENWKKAVQYYLRKDDNITYDYDSSNNISSNAGTGKMKFIRKYDYNEF